MERNLFIFFIDFSVSLVQFINKMLEQFRTIIFLKYWHYFIISKISKNMCYVISHWS